LPSSSSRRFVIVVAQRCFVRAAVRCTSQNPSSLSLLRSADLAGVASGRPIWGAHRDNRGDSLAPAALSERAQRSR
jgi:hypothetical protein